MDLLFEEIAGMRFDSEYGSLRIRILHRKFSCEAFAQAAAQPKNS